VTARLAVVALALLLGGCSSMQGLLTHHVAVTMDEGKCLAASRWGSIAITGDIAASECQAIVAGRRALELIRLLEAAKPAPAAPAPGSKT
jgi:hypothetical protein